MYQTGICMCLLCQFAIVFQVHQVNLELLQFLFHSHPQSENVTDESSPDFLLDGYRTAL